MWFFTAGLVRGGELSAKAQTEMPCNMAVREKEYLHAQAEENPTWGRRYDLPVRAPPGKGVWSRLHQPGAQPGVRSGTLFGPLR